MIQRFQSRLSVVRPPLDLVATLINMQKERWL